MVDVVKIASYIYLRYESEFGCKISEMKLHKLLYFTQRESFVRLGIPLFKERFSAWRYGPVLLKIRRLYKDNLLDENLPDSLVVQFKDIFDFVFATYAVKDAWTLSFVTHSEYSWQKAREGFEPMDACERLMETEDIRIDAMRIKQRRFLCRSFTS